MAKRLLVAYGLWALGGPLGLHHVYLGRDSHALLWLVTLGGFGAGWLCDLPQLPAWVAAANGARRRQQQHRAGTVPPSSAWRFAAQLAAGTYVGTLAGLALPWAPAVPLGAALGVQLAASAGEQTVAAAPVLTAASVTALLSGACVLPTSLAAAAAAQRHRRYKDPAVPRAALHGRLCRLALGYVALAALLAGAVLGRAGAALLQLTRSVCGIAGAALRWARGDNPDTRLQRAYEVLGLSAGSSAEDVHRSYRELVKIWHPDHNRHRAEEAERRFIELQEAYEVLVWPRRAAAAA
ncbi:dnaJ homolog subfamily C member 22 [Nothoprocta perdicaria]|uniref:dnaJ homolog subfamily C member 22 n=1 Tax=Nothoprocta perdicaria TaxID=30464 RepID=UPI000E1BF68D|nr:dnaJ homolog subfamily C member 22 [Nothoprocta perdicaria]